MHREPTGGRPACPFQQRPLVPRRNRPKPQRRRCGGSDRGASDPRRWLIRRAAAPSRPPALPLRRPAVRPPRRVAAPTLRRRTGVDCSSGGRSRAAERRTQVLRSPLALPCPLALPSREALPGRRILSRRTRLPGGPWSRAQPSAPRGSSPPRRCSRCSARLSCGADGRETRTPLVR
jgi:hypothetical protein